MPAKHHIDTKARLIITTWEGDADDVDFIEAIKKYQKDIQSNADYHDFNELVNLTKVRSIKLTIGGIKNISSLASRTDKNRVNVKLAIIVSSSLAYYFARTYESYRLNLKNSTKVVRTFKKESEALAWLQK